MDVPVDDLLETPIDRRLLFLLKQIVGDIVEPNALDELSFDYCDDPKTLVMFDISRLEGEGVFVVRVMYISSGEEETSEVECCVDCKTGRLINVNVNARYKLDQAQSFDISRRVRDEVDDVGEAVVISGILSGIAAREEEISGDDEIPFSGGLVPNQVNLEWLVSLLGKHPKVLRESQ